MKRFLLFTYYADRPQGGVKDFLADFDSVQEAVDDILEERRRYYQIVDRETMRVVKEGLALFKRFEAGSFKPEKTSRRSC